MNVVLLDGTPQDRQALGNNWKKPDTVFVLNSQKPLYEYIDETIKNGNALFRIRICNELAGLDVDYCEVDDPDADFAQNISAANSRHATTFSELLSYINPANTSYVTVNGDIDADEAKKQATRSQLGEIVQQLVYLQMPLNRIRVRTAQEMKTAESVRVFEKSIGKLRDETKQALMKMERDRGAFHDSALWEGVHKSLRRISEYLAQSMQDEMKIAVAATKKTGKSVIVNSMIEQELAPTSLEKATPNNCVYRRREDQYSLQSEGGKVLEFGSGKEGAARLRSKLKEEFNRAQKSEGITIPDMNIGYMSRTLRGITSYTITDTPGPNRKGHEGAEEIARKAVRGTDMAIYAIDYANHLADDEYKYLEWIADEFEKSGKYYSLIFDVNKMDMRYQDKGHKSVPRSLDFIRNELIKINPRYKSCILFGTSAQTYFYALAAEEIPGCEKLATDGLSALPELLERYKDNGHDDDNIFGEDVPEDDDSDPKTVLNFLKEIAGRLDTFHNIKAQSLEDLKQFSGMQSLLSYVSYVAQEKARTEKLNSLMHKIDREYMDIVNLFHFQELTDALAKNRDKLEEVKKLLKEFADKIASIYDKNFPEVYQRCKAGEVQSDWIRKYGQMYPFRWDDVAKEVIGDMKQQFEIRGLLDDIVNDKMPAFLKDQYGAFQRSAQRRDHFGQKKKIRGHVEVLLGSEEISQCYHLAAEKSIYTLPAAIKERFKVANDEMMANYEKAEKDMEAIFQSRQNQLKETVEDFSRRMLDNYSIPFDMETPVFTFEFTRDSIREVHVAIREGENNLDCMTDRLKKVLSKAPLKKGSKRLHRNLLTKLKLTFLPEEDISPIYYDVQAFLKEYREHISYVLYADLAQQHYENMYKGELDKALDVRRRYFDSIKKQMDDESLQLQNFAFRAGNMLDTTGKLDIEKQRMEKQREDLECVQRAVSDLQNGWSKVRPDS